jgi:RiboL-PSP-HEPN
MNNTDVQKMLDDCDVDLKAVKSIIDSLGYSSNIVPYLNRYAIIKACGTVEVAFKSIIADHCSRRAKKQVKTYLSRKIKNSSSNPSFENICNLLGDFDKDWKKDFKDKLKACPNHSSLTTSIQSLVDARNEFAHGGSPSVTISDVISYFSDFREVLNILDSIIA